jgi:hypothetical protein
VGFRRESCLRRFSTSYVDITPMFGIPYLLPCSLSGNCVATVVFRSSACPLTQGIVPGGSLDHELTGASSYLSTVLVLYILFAERSPPLVSTNSQDRCYCAHRSRIPPQTPPQQGQSGSGGGARVHQLLSIIIELKGKAGSLCARRTKNPGPSIHPQRYVQRLYFLTLV